MQQKRPGGGGGGGGQAQVLMSLHDSPAHISQKEAWEEDLAAFDKIKSDYEDDLRRIRWEAYQIVTMLIVFHTVILSAVSQATLLSCRLVWSPLALCGAASAAALAALADKLKSTGDLQVDILDASASISALQYCLDRMDMDGSNLDLDNICPRVSFRPSRHSKLAACLPFCTAPGLVVLAFVIIFTGVFMRLFYVALCDGSCPGCTQSN